PDVGASWAFPSPRALRVGQPNERYPWRWSIVPWLDGVPAYEEPLSADGAAELGRALAQVHVSAPSDAPINPFRSRPLRERAERLDLRLEALTAEHADALSSDAARAMFQAGATQEPADPTWTHLDIHGANVLTQGGLLAGLLDWGDAAAGDPATDLGEALVLVGRELFAPLARAYADAGGAAASDGTLTEATMKRVEAEAVAYAALLAATEDGDHARAGWVALVDLGIADAVPTGLTVPARA
ncbi:phosphotransferase, partial [Demequina sp. TTPB684]